MALERVENLNPEPSSPAPSDPSRAAWAVLQSAEHPIRRQVEVLGRPRVPGLHSFRLCRDLLTGQDLLIHEGNLKLDSDSWL